MRELWISTVDYLRTTSGVLLTLGFAMLALGGGFGWWPVSVLGGVLAVGGAAIRFGRAERRHGVQRSKFLHIQASIGGLDALILETDESLDSRVGLLERGIGELSEFVHRLEALTDSVPRRLQQVEGRVLALDEAVEAHERSLDRLGARRIWSSTRGTMGKHAELMLSDEMGTLETD